MKMEDIDKLISLAEKGLEFYKKMKLDKYDYVMLLTDEDAENRKMFCSLFLKKLKTENKSGIAVTHYKNAAGQIKTIECAYEECMGILQLYLTYEFTDKLIIADFSRPKDRKRLLNFAGYKGYDKEKAASQAIFKIKEG